MPAVDLQPGLVDDVLVHRHLARDAGAKQLGAFGHDRQSDLGEALANLIQPFWMLPILAMLRLSARDVMGYTLVVFFVLTPVVFLLVTLLGMTLRYPL